MTLAALCRALAIAAIPDHASDLRLNFRKHTLDHCKQFGLAPNLAQELSGERPAITGPQRLQRCRPVAPVWIDMAHALQVEKSTNPICVSDTLAQQIIPASKQALVILLLGGRYTHGLGDLMFASVEGDQHPDESFGIGSIGLDPPATAAHLDACRIEDRVSDPTCSQRAVYPKAVISSLIAGANLNRITNAITCSVEQGAKGSYVATGHTEQANLNYSR
jgi:hypothetical protein